MSNGTNRFPASAASTRRIPGATGSSCSRRANFRGCKPSGQPCSFGRFRWRLALAAAVAAIAGGASSAQATSPSLIVFSADRAPSLSGEIYVVGPSGHSVDLSLSPYVDANPVVSPDGKRVAFLSDRSGELGVYEVGIDGRGLVQVGQPATLSETDWPVGAPPELAWQPHGGRLAFAAEGGAWIAQPGQTPVHVRAADGVDGWSPDGHVLAASAYGRGSAPDHELALSPGGRTLWRVEVGALSFATWSAHGLLALTTGRNATGARQAIAVYDETGQLRFKVRVGRLGATETPSSTWSPDGSRLALVSGRAFQVRTTTGRLLLRKRAPQDFGWLSWDGDGRVVLAGYGRCGCHARSVDVRTGRTSPASDRFTHPTSPDGKLAVLQAPSGAGFAIQVARTAGGSPHTYTHVPGCNRGGSLSADAGQFQFVPGSRSIVYTSDCWSPPDDLYSVPADGGAVRQITKPGSDQSQPALSPDGSKAAYSAAPCANSASSLCAAPADIRVLGLDGSGERVVTNPPACTAYPKTFPNGDFAPAWSPDGTTILFSRQSCGSDVLGELVTVPASGGPVHDLGIAGSQPAWGPSRIAYTVVAGQTAADLGLWTANPDGTDPVRVADAGYSPAWSPDGRLAYLTHSKRGTLVVGSTQLTLPFASVSSVSWSPDGTRLVVAARRAGTAASDVYTVNPDGTDPVRLTTNYDASTVSGR